MGWGRCGSGKHQEQPAEVWFGPFWPLPATLGPRNQQVAGGACCEVACRGNNGCRYTSAPLARAYFQFFQWEGTGGGRGAPGGRPLAALQTAGLAVADRQVAFPTAVPISHRAVGGSPYTAPPTSPHNPWLLTHAEPHGPGVWKEQGRPGRGVPKKQSPRFFCVFFRSVLAGRPLARAAARDQGVLPPSHCLQTY